MLPDDLRTEVVDVVKLENLHLYLTKGSCSQFVIVCLLSAQHSLPG